MLNKILITGGAGFIGSNLCDYFIKHTNNQIINLDALTYAGHKISMASFANHPNFFFIKANIQDYDTVAHIIETHKPHTILHLAAETHVDRSIDTPLNFVKTNVDGTAHLLEASLNYWRKLNKQEQANFKFIHVSTDEVFGSIEEPELFNENTPYDPRSPYAASKAAADHLTRSYFTTFGLPTIITNCGNNYGPRQYPEKLIPLALQKILNNESVPIYGDGLYVRDWIYVTDHCRALHKVAEVGIAGSTYLISAMNTLTNIDLLKKISSILKEINPTLKWFNQSNPFTHVKDRQGHDRRYALNSSNTQKSLNWQPHETIETGLAKTISWYLENQNWCDQVIRNNYSLERLGTRT